MPAGCLSEVSKPLDVSLAGSSLPSPFSTSVGEINLPHPSGAGVSREAMPQLFAHRWIAGAGLRCSLRARASGIAPAPGELSMAPRPGLNRNPLCCGDFTSALQGKRVPRDFAKFSELPLLGSRTSPTSPLGFSDYGILFFFFFPSLWCSWLEG